MDAKFICDRITQLRLNKKVSERRMSLDLGHSSSYIRSISSSRALPSMKEFLYICEYLEITPMEFFNNEQQTTLLQQKAINLIKGKSDADIELIISIIERMGN